MDAVRFWDRMSAGYDAQAGKYDKAYAATIALTRQYLKPTDAVLDFACGTGLTTVQLADAVASIHAIDISPKMIEQTRVKCTAKGVSNVTFSVTTLFDDALPESSYDAVLAFNILHGLPDAPQHCARIHRLLKPDGLFISVTDCLKEARLLTRILIGTRFLLHAMPHVSIMSQQEVTCLVESSGFLVLDSQNLFETPPNLFIAARKA